MFLDLTYTQARENASHLKALGCTRVHITCDDSVPWHLVTEICEGGSHRLDMATSIRFEAKDSKAGLSYSWCFDLEPPSANGSGSYHLDVPAIVAVLGKLPAHARRELRDMLADSAAKVSVMADEYQRAADRQRADAATLLSILDAK